jgi:hypothetical protein
MGIGAAETARQHIISKYKSDRHSVEHQTGGVAFKGADLGDHQIVIAL